MILIGSRALALRAPNLLSRRPNDFDFVCSMTEYKQWFAENEDKIRPTKVYSEKINTGAMEMIVEGASNCEFEIIQPNTSSALLAELVANDPETLDTAFGLVPNIDMLFTIKDSHRFKKFEYSTRIFWKTAIDWHMMKQAGAKVRPEYMAFSKLRQKETYAAQKHPKLNVDKDMFFKDDGVVYSYDHDDIHRSVCLDGKPAYEQYLEDGAEVNCSREKFFAVDESVRLAGVVQEACVLSLERALIPYKDKWATTENAWLFALGKVATTITSGYFREYAYNNLFNAIKVFKADYADYYERFVSALNNGRVKPFKQGK